MGIYMMEIAFNEEKILEDGIYNLNDMHERLDKLFQSLQMNKQGKGIYIGGDFAKHGAAVWRLTDSICFMTYVKKWIMVQDSKAEDLVAHYKEEGLIPS
jgi:hypothetical protein